jgi:hypothetical protein
VIGANRSASPGTRRAAGNGAGRSWALGSGAFDPALLPELPGLSELDDLDLPEGVPIGAEHMGGRETDTWVANVPADVGRLFRARLASPG